MWYYSYDICHAISANFIHTTCEILNRMIFVWSSGKKTHWGNSWRWGTLSRSAGRQSIYYRDKWAVDIAVTGQIITTEVSTKQQKEKKSLLLSWKRNDKHPKQGKLCCIRDNFKEEETKILQKGLEKKTMETDRTAKETCLVNDRSQKWRTELQRAQQEERLNFWLLGNKKNGIYNSH